MFLSRFMRLVVVAIFLLAGISTIIVIHNRRLSRATVGNDPSQIFRGGGKLPARENLLANQPQFPQNDPRFPLTTAPLPQTAGQTELNISPGMAPIPLEGKGETYPLPAPTTTVHRLSDAGAMGVMPNPAGLVGMPQVNELPPEARTQVHKLDVQSITAPLGSAGNAIGVPPGVPPDEVGRTKTVPVKK